MNSSFTVSLVQISDIHWDIADSSLFSVDPYIVPGREVLKTIRDQFVKSIQDAVNHARIASDRVILILGGDNVYRSNYKVTNINLLLSELLIPIIGTQSTGGTKFDEIIAVPGNHDVFDPNRKAKKPISDQLGGSPPIVADKFFRFKAWCKLLQKEIPTKLHTPFEEPCFRIYTTWNEPILFWAVNSSSKCGSLERLEVEVRAFRAELMQKKNSLTGDTSVFDGLIEELDGFLPSGEGDNTKSYDPGYVEDNDMERCTSFASGGDDALRIAVLHHNNLPTKNDDAQRYRFLNASKFNNYLLRKRFRIICHGHQHIGELAQYSKLTTFGENAHYATHPHNGFLAIGAPAFDLVGHDSDQQGFTITRIEIAEKHHICTVQIDKHLWDGDGFSLHKSGTEIVLKPTLEPDREKCLQDVKRVLFSDLPFKAIVRSIDSHDYEQGHAESLRSKIERFTDVRAIYAVSVFAPGDWLGSKLIEFLLPFGRRNIQKATRRYERLNVANEYQQSGLAFDFSMPLMHALRTAARNAQSMDKIRIKKFADKLENRQYIQARDFVLSRHMAFESGIEQMSRFGEAIINEGVSEPAEISDEQWIVQAGARRPYTHYSGSYTAETNEVCKLFEFPRIVLWEAEEFMRPSTLDIIEFHENMGFPLFWIDPALLRTNSGLFRNRIGYVSVLSFDENDSDKQSAKEHLHEIPGKNFPAPPDLPTLLWGASPVALWELDKMGMGLSEDRFYSVSKSNYAMHEFIWLLGHPSICFAADAWLARYVGDNTFKNFRSQLAEKLVYPAEVIQPTAPSTTRARVLDKHTRKKL